MGNQSGRKWGSRSYTNRTHVRLGGGCVRRLELARQILCDTERRLGLERKTLDWDISAKSAGIWEYRASYPELIRTLTAFNLEGALCAVVGADDFGWENASAQGLNLESCLYVPSSYADAQILSLLIPHCRVIYVEKCALTCSDMRRLGAQVRMEKVVLLSSYSWVGISRIWERDQSFARKAG